MRRKNESGGRAQVPPNCATRCHSPALAPYFRISHRSLACFYPYLRVGMSRSVPSLAIPKAQEPSPSHEASRIMPIPAVFVVRASQRHVSPRNNEGKSMSRRRLSITRPGNEPAPCPRHPCFPFEDSFVNRAKGNAEETGRKRKRVD